MGACGVTTTLGRNTMHRIQLVAAGALALASVPALAANHVVHALSTRLFSPATLTINIGDTVTFVNDGGFHNVASDAGAVTSFHCADACGTSPVGDASSNAWSSTVTFPTVGSVPFHCDIHAGIGMVGTITVVEPTPFASVDPVSLSASAEAGASTTTSFAIANSGDASLSWNADTATSDCAAPSTIPWLSLSPPNGSIAVGAPASNVDVTLNATGLPIGMYSANVCVHSNDAAHDPLSLPVEFTVIMPDLIFTDGLDG
jgi:plastocyanin